MRTILLFLAMSCVTTLRAEIELPNPILLDDTAAVEMVDVRQFFESKGGSYKVLKAGGETITKEETLDVDAVNDPNEAAIYAPYCEPGTNLCDIGYISLPWSETKVFKVTTSEGQSAYEILCGEGAAQKRYQWVELSDGRILFRNFQYLLPSTQKSVVLDHEVEKVAN